MPKGPQDLLIEALRMVSDADVCVSSHEMTESGRFDEAQHLMSVDLLSRDRDGDWIITVAGKATILMLDSSNT